VTNRLAIATSVTGLPSNKPDSIQCTRVMPRVASSSPIMNGLRRLASKGVAILSAERDFLLHGKSAFTDVYGGSLAFRIRQFAPKYYRG
jgi:hypothetical protein